MFCMQQHQFPKIIRFHIGLLIQNLFECRRSLRINQLSLSFLLNRLFYLIGTTGRIGFDLFTPKPQYYPSVDFEFFGNFFVALYVSLYLRNPKVLPHFEILFTPFPIITVPKLAVAKYRNFLSDKRYVGMPENRLYIFSIAQTFFP